jgi:hypothetical protein
MRRVSGDVIALSAANDTAGGSLWHHRSATQADRVLVGLLEDKEYGTATKGCDMHRGMSTTAAVLSALLAGAGDAHAQSSAWTSFITISPIFESTADFDRGGDFDASGAILRVGADGDLGGGVRAGVRLNYDYVNYSFSNPVAFGGLAPWDVVQRYGVAVPFSFALADGWSIGVAPAVDWFRENGARSGDSLAWGATFSAVRRLPDGNLIGFGAGAFSQIEDTAVRPFVIVDWRLGDRWRLVNPLASGPTGGAGLELDYRFDSGWTLGVGAAFREVRFRLDQSGPVPNGVGEVRGVPVFLRGTFALSPQLSLRLYAGVITGGRLRVEDPSGNLLRQDDYDAAPMAALALHGRF